MKEKLKFANEKGITLVGLIILIAIIVFVIIIMRWAYGLSQTVKEKTKKYDAMEFLETTTSSSIE